MYHIREISIDALDESITECEVAVWSNGDRTKIPSVLNANRELLRAEKDAMILVAQDAKGRTLGFRFGHAEKEQSEFKVFYDQNGGVHPEHRRQGIARSLLREQHRIAKSRGYSHIRTGVAIPMKPMIILNLQEGFEITELRWCDIWNVKVLWFIKEL